MNIYIGNLSYNATEEDLKNLFSQHGTVSSVRIIKDKMTQKPKGFAFVEMESEEEGSAAIEALNGQDFLERNLVINKAHERKEHGNRGGGGGGRGGRGNYRGGGHGGGNRRYDSRGGGQGGGGYHSRNRDRDGNF